MGSNAEAGGLARMLSGFVWEGDPSFRVVLQVVAAFDGTQARAPLGGITFGG